MWTIQQIVGVVLFLAKALYKALSGSTSLAELEQAILRMSQEAARRLLEAAVEEMDNRLLAAPENAGLEVVNRKERRVMMLFGEVSIQRRYYRDPRTGKRRFLLDEALGLEPGQRLSPGVTELGVKFAVDMPYGRAAECIAEATAGAVHVSKMALWKAVQKAGEAAKAKADAQRKALFEFGEVPPGEKQAEALCVEADGVFLPTRGCKGHRERIEVKLAVAYDGKADVAPSRRKLRERRIHGAVAGSKPFFEETVADFGQHWDLASIHHCTFGADGASWLKQGLEYFPGAVYRLDPFHLRRALREGLGHDARGYADVCEALANGDPWEEVARHLGDSLKRSRGQARERVRTLTGYLGSNWDGIRKNPDAQRLGTIEGQVFHHVARRMKRHGAQWSRAGADHLVRLAAQQANGELQPLAKKTQASVRTKMTAGAILREGGANVDELGDWLQASLPALNGPHANRPWVQMLRDLIHSAEHVG